MVQNVLAMLTMKFNSDITTQSCKPCRGLWICVKKTFQMYEQNQDLNFKKFIFFVAFLFLHRNEII